MAKIHGVSVRNKKTKELVEFIETDYGRTTLSVLSGIRINMSPEFIAQEENIEQSEISAIKA